MIIDLSTDDGYTKLSAILGEGRLNDLPRELDLDELLAKQAYADTSAFADPVNRQFAISSPEETLISIAYAEKCASELIAPIKERLNEACDIYGLPHMKIATPIVQPGDQFEVTPVETEKKASATTYGTELETCLLARASARPEHAAEFEKIGSLKAVIAPLEMVNLIKEADAAIGLDLPWFQAQLGTPEHAVFAKFASDVSIDLGPKVIALEDFSQHGEMLTDLGVDIDFDNDPYTIKHAVESLPDGVKRHIALLI